MPVKEVSPDAVPGKLGGKTAKFKRAFKKLHSQKVYAYEMIVRFPRVYVVATLEPPLLNKKPGKRAPKKAK